MLCGTLPDTYKLCFPLFCVQSSIHRLCLFVSDAELNGFIVRSEYPAQPAD